MGNVECGQHDFAGAKAFNQALCLEIFQLSYTDAMRFQLYRAIVCAK